MNFLIIFYTQSNSVFNLLCSVNIQAWRLDMTGLMTEALAKSAEMPNAATAHSQGSDASCCMG